METSLSRGGLSLDTLSAPPIEATLRRGVTTTIDKALLDAAWEMVRPVVRWTPMLRSDHVDSLVGARVFLKAESLQLAGSFKMRGACFRVSRLSPDERGRGVDADARSAARRRARAGAIRLHSLSRRRRRIDRRHCAGREAFRERRRGDRRRARCLR